MLNLHKGRRDQPAVNYHIYVYIIILLGMVRMIINNMIISQISTQKYRSVNY
jgi:hypothetical protein